MGRPPRPHTGRQGVKCEASGYPVHGLLGIPRCHRIGRCDVTTSEELLRRITARPDVLGGKPIIRDLRVSVESVLAFLSEGVGPDEILRDHPGLEADDIRACAAYARLAVARGAAAVAGDPPRAGSSPAGSAPPSRVTLRELARRPLDERRRTIAAATIAGDAGETAAWDATAGDGLEE